METTTFKEVSIRVVKSGKCVTCGKPRRRTRKFWQTLNPYNKKPDGTIKTRIDIMKEIEAQAQVWKVEPIDCCAMV